ncbi:MAG: hypothetical protein ABIP74_01205, partial [Candidatus Saccharimonas sp.]
MTVETMNSRKEFERLSISEVERKLLPVIPERLTELRESAYPIEQYYLSHMNEPFSLRFRGTVRDGAISYEATLKDSGVMGPDGLERLEVPVIVPSELYAYYFDKHTTPVLQKWRSEPFEGIIVDFYKDDGSVQVEVEDATHWDAFTEHYGKDYLDITGDHVGSNEWRAHLSFRRLHNGKEALMPQAELRSQDIVNDILSRRLQTAPVIVHIGGRSGSGKSTIVHEVQRALRDLGLSNDVLS